MEISDWMREVCKRNTGVVNFFFFFQAEDGIRDRNVTGVQTCALPIWLRDPRDLQGHPGRQEGVPPEDATLDARGRAVSDVLSLTPPRHGALGSSLIVWILWAARSRRTACTSSRS